MKRIDTSLKRMRLASLRFMKRIATWAAKVRKKARLKIIKYYYKLVAIYAIAQQAISRDLSPLILALVAVLSASSALFLANPNNVDELSWIRSLDSELSESISITIGGSLIGATAIVFSVILFAMQVNVERMPHGLFRRLSRDLPLLVIFAVSFLFALSVIFSPAYLSSMWALWWAAAATLSVVSCFFFAYERSLKLINPAQQFQILARDASNDLKRWGRHARRLAPAYRDVVPVSDPADPFASRHDLGMWLFFKNHPHWQDHAKRAIDYSISMARRSAVQGDYEASAVAFSAIVHIHRGYIDAKGLTFFSHIPFFSNPLAGDGFITHSLEHLRQTTAIGIQRNDEQQITQTLSAYAGIAAAYLEVDYAQENADHSEATLAVGYMGSDLKRVSQTEFTDVVMNGTRLMGNVARTIVVRAKPEEAHGAIETLESVAIFSILQSAKSDFNHAATGTVVGQLCEIFTTTLLYSAKEVRFTLSEIQKCITLIAKTIIYTPDNILASWHSSALAKFYSLTEHDALGRKLEQLVQELLKLAPEDERVSKILNRLEGWADQLAISQRDLLVKAIEKRSHFAFDLIHWLAHLAKLLMLASTAPGCGDLTKRKLRKHAQWLASALSWIPGDNGVVKWVETYQVTEQLFDMAWVAYQLDLEASDTVLYCDLLLDWSFKSSQEPNGWSNLERGLYGLTALAVADGAQVLLLAKLKQELLKDTAPPQDELDRTARHVREKAFELGSRQQSLSRIEQALDSVDSKAAEICLISIANLLSPATSGETRRRAFRGLG